MPGRVCIPSVYTCCSMCNYILRNIAKCKPDTQCAKRTSDYMAKRRYYEDILRKEFQKKGGMIKRISPHYMVVEQSQWLNDWYEICRSTYLDGRCD